MVIECDERVMNLFRRVDFEFWKRGRCIFLIDEDLSADGVVYGKQLDHIENRQFPIAPP